MESTELLQYVLQAASSKKAQELISLDVIDLTSMTDYFVVCHGNSDTQVQAIANEIEKKVKSLNGIVRGIEGYDKARWILLDLGDVIVHVFHRDERVYYNIERLWSDAKVQEYEL